eukprot:13419753-Alexandrium_andersonii.AAC.1
MVAAGHLALPISTAPGAYRWGGHALRCGGAQFFGAAGVDVWRIQALARHRSGGDPRMLPGCPFGYALQ